MKSLDKVNKNQKYRLKEIKECEMKSRLIQLGFHEDSFITLLRAAPLFNDPMLFSVGDSQIALTKFEASHIHVEEAHE